MRRIQNSHILAAALLIAGAAGLVFAGTGLRANPNTSVSSDDVLVESIGTAPPPLEVTPVEQIFGPSVERELVLITYGGWFDRRTASYLHRRVIFAVLAEDELNPPAEPDNASS